MVIISTMAIEVIIQAVSPELGEHSFWTFESHANVSTVCPDSSAAGAGSCAYEWVTVEKLRKTPKRTANMKAASPARIGFLNVMVFSCP
jgi:hypothetical protein